MEKMKKIYNNRCSSWSQILRAKEGGLVNKVRSLLQWDPEAKGGVFIVRPPTKAPMHTMIVLLNKVGSTKK